MYDVFPLYYFPRDLEPLDKYTVAETRTSEVITNVIDLN